MELLIREVFDIDVRQKFCKRQDNFINPSIPILKLLNISGGIVIFLAQEAVKNSIPMTFKMRVITPIVGAGLVGYFVTRRRTKHCLQSWMIMDGKSLQGSYSPP